MKRSLADRVIERANMKLDRAVAASRAYLAPVGQSDSTERTQSLISGDPTASELLARGYPQYVAESVARSRMEDQ